MKHLLPLALALIALPLAAQAECKGTPVPELVEGRAFAVDGDTLAIPGQPRIRLWGIQAPELRDSATKRETPEGMIARAALADLLDGDAPTRCVPTKWDRYCRLVAVCHTAGADIDLGQAMLIRGMAYTAWLDDTPGKTGVEPAMYASAESLARKTKRGLWRAWLE